jgi:hypothetical protein
MNFSVVDTVLNAGVEQGVFPGAVVLVGQVGKVLYRRAWLAQSGTRTYASIR